MSRWIVLSRWFSLSITEVIDFLHSEGVENEAVEQVCFADKVLLNKIDLVDDKTLHNIEAKLRELNPTASIIRCRHSKVSPKELLKIEAFNLNRVLDFEPDFLADDQE